MRTEQLEKMQAPEKKIGELKFRVLTVSPLRSRIFKIRWAAFMEDIDAGSILGPYTLEISRDRIPTGRHCPRAHWDLQGTQRTREQKV